MLKGEQGRHPLLDKAGAGGAGAHQEVQGEEASPLTAGPVRGLQGLPAPPERRPQGDRPEEG